MKKILLILYLTCVFLFFVFIRSHVFSWYGFTSLFDISSGYTTGFLDIFFGMIRSPIGEVYLLFGILGPIVALITFIYSGKYTRIYISVLTLLFCLFLLPAVRYTGIGKEYVTERIFSGMLARGVEYTIINTGEILKLTDYDIDASWGIGEFSTFNPIFCGKERCYNTIHRKTPFLELFPHASFPRDPRREWVQYLGDWTEYLLILGSR